MVVVVVPGGVLCAVLLRAADCLAGTCRGGGVGAGRLGVALCGLLLGLPLAGLRMRGCVLLQQRRGGARSGVCGGGGAELSGLLGYLGCR